MSEVDRELVVQEIARHQSRIRAFVRCLLVRPSDVDDVLQDINSVLWQKADEYQRGTDFWAWASQIARFKVLNQVRKYGRELAPTPDNFGVSGQLPSHPELLDHLAVTFVEDGWSVKRLIRRLVLSRVYRLTTTDVLVLDATRTVLYHGAIDDQYGFDYSIEAPRYRYLADALAAIKLGKQPLVSATEAPSCTLERPSAPPAKTDVTYHNRISRIVQQHCLECPCDGGVAPFALATLDDVVGHAAIIKQVVERGIMPPWFAADAAADGTEKNEKVTHTPWANDRSLAVAERQDLLAWIAGGKPAGDRRDAPQPRQFETGWLIGKPDAVYQFAKPVAIKATGVMPYQKIVVETNLTEDKWVQAIEVQPGDRGVAVRRRRPGLRSGQAEHHHLSRRRSRLRRHRREWVQRHPDSACRFACQERLAIHRWLCQSSGLLAITRGSHERSVSASVWLRATCHCGE